MKEEKLKERIIDLEDDLKFLSSRFEGLKEFTEKLSGEITNKKKVLKNG